MLVGIRRAIAASLALLVIVLTLGTVRGDWSGAPSAPGRATGEDRATSGCLADER